MRSFKQPVIKNNEIICNEREFPFYMERISMVIEREDLNQSFYDVGCQVGFDCFELVKEGATNVVGVDNNPGHIETAKMISVWENLDVIFNLGDYNTDKHYDVMLFFNFFTGTIPNLDNLDFNTAYIDLAPHEGINDKLYRIIEQREVIKNLDIEHEIIRGKYVDLIRIVK